MVLNPSFKLMNPSTLPNDIGTWAAIQPLLDSFIEPGSTIYTDCWRSYNYLDDPNIDYDNEKVDHSRSYVTYKRGFKNPHQ